MTVTDDTRQGFISLVEDLAAQAGPDGLSLREIRDRMDERAFGLMIVILAIPCLVPAIQGIPQIVAVPIILLAGQMLLGRSEPWMPQALLKRRVSRELLQRMAVFARRRMAWFEALSRPRLTFLAGAAGERLAAVMIILATVCILPPITNTIPSLAITLMAAGLVQRDGLFVGAGAALAAAWITALAALIAGFALGAGWAAALAARFTG